MPACIHCGYIPQYSSCDNNDHTYRYQRYRKINIIIASTATITMATTTPIIINMPVGEESDASSGAA